MHVRCATRRAGRRTVGDLLGTSPRHVNVSETFRAYVAAQLPEFMIPAAFVELARLPLNINGKVDRDALPAPVDTRPAPESAYVAPRNALEEQLASLWSELLGVERVGAHDNFFELAAIPCWRHGSWRGSQQCCKCSCRYGDYLSCPRLPNWRPRSAQGGAVRRLFAHQG